MVNNGNKNFEITPEFLMKNIIKKTVRWNSKKDQTKRIFFGKTDKLDATDGDDVYILTENQHRLLLNEFDKLQNEIDGADANLKKAIEKNSEKYQVKIDELTEIKDDEILRLQQEIKTKENECESKDSLIEDYAAQIENIEDNENKLNEYKNIIDEKQSKINELKGENNSIKSKLDKLTQQMQSDKDYYVKELKETMINNQSHIDEIMQKHHEILDNMDKKYNEIMDLKQSEINSLKNENRTLESENKSLQREVFDYAHKYNSIRETIIHYSKWRMLIHGVKEIEQHYPPLQLAIDESAIDVNLSDNE